MICAKLVLERIVLKNWLNLCRLINSVTLLIGQYSLTFFLTLSTSFCYITSISFVPSYEVWRLIDRTYAFLQRMVTCELCSFFHVELDSEVSCQALRFSVFGSSSKCKYFYGPVFYVFLCVPKIKRKFPWLSALVMEKNTIFLKTMATGDDIAAFQFDRERNVSSPMQKPRVSETEWSTIVKITIYPTLTCFIDMSVILCYSCVPPVVNQAFCLQISERLQQRTGQ
jgi:hypothetical protein